MGETARGAGLPWRVTLRWLSLIDGATTATLFAALAVLPAYLFVEGAGSDNSPWWVLEWFVCLAGAATTGAAVGIGTWVWLSLSLPERRRGARACRTTVLGINAVGGLAMGGATPLCWLAVASTVAHLALLWGPRMSEWLTQWPVEHGRPPLLVTGPAPLPPPIEAPADAERTTTGRVSWRRRPRSRR